MQVGMTTSVPDETRQLGEICTSGSYISTGASCDGSTSHIAEVMLAITESRRGRGSEHVRGKKNGCEKNEECFDVDDH